MDKTQKTQKRVTWTREEEEAFKDGSILFEGADKYQNIMNMFPQVFKDARMNEKNTFMNTKLKDKKRNALTKIFREYPVEYGILDTDDSVRVDDVLPWYERNSIVAKNLGAEGVTRWEKFQKRAGKDSDISERMRALKLSLLYDMNSTESDVEEFKKGKKGDRKDCLTCDWYLHGY